MKLTRSLALSALAVTALYTLPLLAQQDKEPLKGEHAQSHGHATDHAHETAAKHHSEGYNLDHDHQHDDELSQMGAHVHGEALLTFVLEGNEAMLALQSAASNVVGFEHAPSTDEHHQEIQAALAVLAKGDWFNFSRDAGCQIEQANASTDLTRQNYQSHGDFYANFSLLCHNPARLQDIELGLLQLMPAIQRVEVQWILNERQGMSRATMRDSRVQFH